MRVQALSEIDMGAAPKLRDQELTLAERLISEVSGTELHPERYEDEYRKRLVKAIEQKAAGQEVARVEIAARPAPSPGDTLGDGEPEPDSVCC